MFDPDDELLPSILIPIAEAFAVEGIPVNAIARGLRQSAGLVWATLERAREVGNIVEIPSADWPPTAKRGDRVPLASHRVFQDLLVASRKGFKLTNLEARFFVVLMTHDNADKEKLHHVVGDERRIRNPASENTDPKMVDVIICKLRKKLLAFGVSIETIWGHGYFIAPPMKEAVMTKLGVGHADVPNPK